MRLQLRGLRQRHRPEKRGAAEPVRARRQRHHAHAQDALCRVRRYPGNRQSAGDRTHACRRRGRRRRHRRGTIRPRRHSSRAPGSTSRVRRKRPGISISIWRRAASTTPSAICSACFRITSRRWSMPCLPRSARRPTFRSPAALARRSDRRRLARRGARHAVPAHLLHHRRRAAAKGQGARLRRRSGRRCRDARRAGRAGEISRHPARSRSVHRSARSAAAAALFDRVVAEGRARQSGAHHRHRSLQDRQARADAASPRPISPTASRPAPRSRPISRRRSISACPPTRRSRSS